MYYVRVRARNAFGASAPSNEVIVYVPGSPSAGCPGAPVSPVGLSSTVTGSFVTLSWTYPLTSIPVSGYRLEVGSAPGLSNVLQVPLGAATVFGGAATPGSYYVRLTVTPANNTGNVFLAAIALLGHPRNAPTPNPPV